MLINLKSVCDVLLVVLPILAILSFVDIFCKFGCFYAVGLLINSHLQQFVSIFENFFSVEGFRGFSVIFLGSVPLMDFHLTF